MQVIEYRILQGVDDAGEAITSKVVLQYTEENLALARAEAYLGEVSEPYDDGQPERQTQEEQIQELREALDLLLSGVTE